MFPNYKVIYNNANDPFTCYQWMPIPPKLYTPLHGGLLTTIHDWVTTLHFPHNIKKLPTSIHLSPYLQILYLQNRPFHLYMPMHRRDTHLTDIKQPIVHTILQHPQDLLLMSNNLNRGIFLQGGTHNNKITPPTMDDTEWQLFTHSLHLYPILKHTIPHLPRRFKFLVYEPNWCFLHHHYKRPHLLLVLHRPSSPP